MGGVKFFDSDFPEEKMNHNSYSSSSGLNHVTSFCIAGVGVGVDEKERRPEVFSLTLVLAQNKILNFGTSFLIHAQAQTKAQDWKVVHYFRMMVSVLMYIRTRTNVQNTPFKELNHVLR